MHGHNARFEFRNVNTVTVSGLEFVGCFKNRVVSVGRFQLESSSFLDNGQDIVNCTVLTIEDSYTILDRVAFISIKFADIFATVVYSTDTNLVVSHSTFTNSTGLILEAWYTNVSIRHSKCIGNNGYSTLCTLHGMITNIDYSNFINNTRVIVAENTSSS